MSDTNHYAIQLRRISADVLHSNELQADADMLRSGMSAVQVLSGAADEIERLRAEVERLRAELKSFTDNLVRACIADLPPWDDLCGVAPDATGELSSEAFVRKLRDEWEGKS